MKRIILLFLLVSFYSCNNSSSEKSTESDIAQSQLERDYEIADMLLQFDAEKVGLLSIIKDVPQEKASAVLRDYLAKSIGSSILLTMKDRDYIVKVVDTIAEKNGLSRKLTASIIFSYQYEMVTEEEIIEEHSTNEYYEDH